MKTIYTLLAIFILLQACDDPVDISLENESTIYSIDAWLTNTSDTQKIRLTYTRPYFDNGTATPVLGATVAVGELESAMIYNFTDADNDGVYEWISSAGASFGNIGNTYGLQVDLADGSSFQSFTVMDTVPALDSITFEYNKKNPGFNDDWYFAEFWSRDLPGLGNSYWIKAFKNGDFLSDPEDINFSYDAGGSPGAEVDSLIFIQPVRSLINPYEDEFPANSPYTFGDTLRVEIHAISFDAMFFLYRVQDETIRLPGFAQLFASPLANSPTNIIPMNEPDKVVGFFSVAAVSSLEVVMSEDLVVDRYPD